MSTNYSGNTSSTSLKRRVTYILFFILLVAGINSAFGQEFSASLEAFNRERISLNKTGMMILSGWAAANLIGSSYGYFRTNGKMKYFHQRKLLGTS